MIGFGPVCRAVAFNRLILLPKGFKSMATRGQRRWIIGDLFQHFFK